MASIWDNPENIKTLQRVKLKEITVQEAAAIVGVSVGACQLKLKRLPMNGAEVIQQGRNWKNWSVSEMLALYAMHQSKMEWVEIGAKLDRTPTSCQRCWQDTNWTEYLVKHPADPKAAKPLIENRLASYVLDLARYSPDRLAGIDKKFLMDKVKGTGVKDFNFERVKQLAEKQLAATGELRPKGKQFGKGTYIVVGDSHGKHTKRGVFRMLSHLKNHVGAKNIIHIGHILDDDNDASICWSEMTNVIVVAKKGELKLLCAPTEEQAPTEPDPIDDQNDGVEEQSQVEAAPEQAPYGNRFEHEVLRDYIMLGKLMVGNQDFIQDYSMTSLGSLPRNYFDQSAILSLHRHELVTRTTCHEDTQLFSPGCLCQPHIIKTIKQIDFTTDQTVKVAYNSGFIKYHKMDHWSQNWEMGVCIVHVDEDGDYDVIQTRIHLTSVGFACSYFDKIVTENGVMDPAEKIFFNADSHCDRHNPEVLSLEEQFCKDYKPTVSVDVGDFLNNKSFNHHIMKQSNSMVVNYDVVAELAHAKWILKRRSTWAKRNLLMYGNHERFARDISDRMPQMAGILNLQFMLDLEGLGVELVDFKQRLRVGQAQFIHGDMKLIGAKGGGKLDKVFNTFGSNTVMGHSHSPAVRFGCYVCGHSGLLDQEYNETEASGWMNGFGFCNIFEETPFFTLVNIRRSQFWVNGKTYRPKNVKAWDLPKFKAAIDFRFEEN